MKLVYILGTDHRYQWADPGLSADQIAAFRECLCRTCALEKISAIAEEMSIDALSENGCTHSVPADVAAKLGLPHLYCDPSRAKQHEIGICDENAVRVVAQFHGDPDFQVEELVLRERRKREPLWIDGIQELAKFPTLFICGSWHVPSFSALLTERGLKSSVVHERWEA